MNAITRTILSDQDHDLVFTFAAEGDPEAGFEVLSFSAQESLSELARVDLALVSQRADIDLGKLLDKPGVLTIHDRFGEKRYFHGVIAHIEQGDTGARHHHYAATLLPELHRLRFGSDSRIFQNKTVVEIVDLILSEHKVKHVKWRLSKAAQRPPREYCVQYRETHYDFVTRLLAEEGIYYTHHMFADRHELEMGDATQSAETTPNLATLSYNSTPGGDVKGPHARRFVWREGVRSGKVVERDHTFRNPNAALEHRWQANPLNGGDTPYEVYEGYGRYKTDVDGLHFTRLRLDMLRAEASLGEGEGRCQLLTPGYFVSLEDHPNPARNRKYLTITVSHHGQQPGAAGEDSGDAGPGGGGTFLTTAFRCIPSDVPWRPAPRTKPMAEGAEMAIVSGPAGEEIFTDEFGRVKVHFPWDRRSGRDDQSSCWIRVSQNWAGGAWGHVALPRIGQHVIVDFLHADPDQPVITGRLYNAVNPVPYPLPAHKTKMVIRSDTHKGAGYNEISFEDENGQQNMFIHAQKDQTLKVLNNRAKRVEANQVESIGANKSIEVGGNHQEKIGGAMNISVGGGAGGALMGALGAVLAAGGKDGAAGASMTGNPLIGTFMSGIAAAGALAESASSAGNAGFNAAGGHFAEAGKAQQGAAASLGGILSSIMPMSGIASAVIEKFQSTTVGLASTEQIGLMKNTSVGHTETKQVGKLKKTDVGERYELSAGKVIFSKTGKNIMIATEKIILAAPGGVIEINKEGIKIKGKKIDIEGDAINLGRGKDGCKASSPFMKE